jgi:hypothetical protein
MELPQRKLLYSGSYHFSGQDYVLLQDGFKVSGTATAIISIMKCQPKQSNQVESEPGQEYYQRLINNRNIARHTNNENGR